MKIRELVGKEIMNAYDGHYLSEDFGYSCANFNVRSSYTFFENNKWEKINEFMGEEENPPYSFDFYTKNTKNVSCFVCFNDQKKICGRRMFFKGPSLVDEKEFDVPIKKGELVKYLYGYYGAHVDEIFQMITRAAIKKYGQGILYTDRVVLNNGNPDYEIANYWIMGVQKTNFRKYPPIDVLTVSTELNALSNFDPSNYILDFLKKDFKKENIEFHQGYRFEPTKIRRGRFDYKTWDTHHGVIKGDEDLTTFIEEEEDID